VRPHNLDKKLILAPNSQTNFESQIYTNQIKIIANEKIEILEVNIKNPDNKTWYLLIGGKTFYPFKTTQIDKKVKIQSSDNIEKITQKTDFVEIFGCSNCEAELLGNGKVENSSDETKISWTIGETSRLRKNFEIASYNKFANPLLISSFIWQKQTDPNCAEDICKFEIEFFYFDSKVLTKSEYGENAKLVYYEIKKPEIKNGVLIGELWLTASVNYILDYNKIREIVKNSDLQTAKTKLQESFPNIKNIDTYNTGIPIDFRFIYIETR
jgi:hypothetical protein